MAPSRIEELRRRVQADPASIAFAQLAEEYRRSGQTDEAVRVCQEGLTRHPGYLSARVTLGRALLDLSELDAARAEFEFVVAEAPENLAAVRGLAEISQRDGQLADALNYYRRALALARHDPEIEEIVQQLSRQVGVAAAGAPGALSFEEAHQELLSAAERVPVVAPRPAPVSAFDAPTAPFDFERLVAALGSPAAPPQLEAAVAGRPGGVPAIELAETIDLGPNPFAALEAELRAHEAAPAGAATEPAELGRYEGSAVKSGPNAADAPASADAVLEDTMLAESIDPSWVPAAADPDPDPGPDEDRAAAEAPTVILSAVSTPSEASEADAPGSDAETVALAVAAAGLTGAGVPEVLADAEVPAGAPEASLDPTDVVAEPPADSVEGPTPFAEAASADPAETAVATGDGPRAAAVEAVADDRRETPEPPAEHVAEAEVAAAAIASGAPGGTSGDVLDDLESWLNTLHDRSAS